MTTSSEALRMLTRPFDHHRHDKPFSVMRGLLTTTHCTCATVVIFQDQQKDNGANQATNDQTKFSLQLKSILDSKCEGIPVNLHCLGVEGSEEQLMACHDDGRLTCSDLNTFYRPTQFIIRLHTDTNSGTTPIVSILSLGMGPSDTFFVAFTENTFAVVEAKEFKDKDNPCLPKDKKFHFCLFLGCDEESLQFQAVTGIKPFLAFSGDGEPLIGEDVPTINTLFTAKKIAKSIAIG
jgi:hypothetical protein